MKLMKKTLSMFLCAVFMCSSAACFGESNQSIVSVPDNVIHQVENTLHKVNVVERNVPFVVNGETNYKIYVDLSNPSLTSAIAKSANFVSEQVLSATTFVASFATFSLK